MNSISELEQIRMCRIEISKLQDLLINLSDALLEKQQEINDELYENYGVKKYV